MIKKIIATCMIALLAVILPFHVSHAQLFKDFSVRDEKELAKEFEILVKARLPIIEEPEIKLYVQSVVQKILTTAPPQPFNFETNVIYSPVLNAFATPGGYVCVFSGLLINIEDEDSLAGILAHEIAHVTQRHIASRIDRSKYLSIGTLVALVGAALAGGGEASGALIAGSVATTQAAMLSYNRDDESEADKFGLQYMLKAGYNPQGMAKAFQVLQNKSLGGGSDFPTYLSTHPNINARIATVNSFVRTLKPAHRFTLDNTKFIRAKSLAVAYYADMRFADNYFSGKKTAYDYMGLGIVARKRNQIKQAEEYLQKAVELAPDDFLMNRELGRFYFDVGEFSPARTYLEKAIRINPRDYMAIFFHARLLDSENQVLEAQREYEKVLKYAPEDGEVLNFYGRVLGRQGKEFDGYLQLALAEIYKNNEGRANSWLKRADNLASSSQEKERLKKAQNILAERKKYWK